ncbi:membrane protein [Escherichia coli]|nr:membrane protein [Escherichia coli]
MQLEVPRDQYAGAVETMRNKIREGKVPGVTDPAEASRLIRRGHLTYTQARNITPVRDHRIGSLMILPRVRLSVWRPEGVSFALTASVFWLSTGDRDAALQTAAVQAGKTFTRTLAVYVTTQHSTGSVLFRVC